MNILVVANIPPYAKGGAENQARMLSEEFVNLGHSVTVVGNEIPKDTSSENLSFETVHLPTFKTSRATRALSYFLSLSTFLLRRKGEFDVIYCRFLGEAALSICLLKSFFKWDVPLIPCTACAGKTGDAELLKSLPKTKTLVKLINENCNAINNISPKIGEELEEIGVNSSLFRFYPNGIRTQNSELKKTVSNPRKIVFLGRLAPQKAIPVLLQSTRQLIDQGRYFELHIIGDGPDRLELSNLVDELDLSQFVTFHGHIENKRLPEILPSFDIFVLPSLFEGFATATIEAMLAGLPAVVTKSGGPNYFVDEEVGRVCAVNDVADLSFALSEILSLDSDALISMGERARQRVIEKFDIEVLAKTYESLFESLISNSSKK